MSGKTKERDDSLKYQWRLQGLVLRSSWATGLDKSVSFEIIDRYRKDFGNSRASLSFLQEATGADRKSIIASVRRLVEHGPFEVARQGAGTRPTEYRLKFELVAETASGGAEPTASNDNPSSGVQPTTGSGVEPTTKAASSGVQPTQTDLQVSAYKAGLLVDDRGCAGAGGLGAAARATGFARLFEAYGKAGDNRAKASAALDEANPTEGELEAMIVAAAAWRETAKGHRMSLERWIREERWKSTKSAPKAGKREHRYPSCTVTRMKKKRDAEGMDGAQLWFRDRDGEARTIILNQEGLLDFRYQCENDRPEVEWCGDDFDIFVGARFMVDTDGSFYPYSAQWEAEEAA